MYPCTWDQRLTPPRLVGSWESERLAAEVQQYFRAEDNGSAKLCVAPLSTSMVRVESSEKTLAADEVTVVAMNAPKTPSGMRRFC